MNLNEQYERICSQLGHLQLQKEALAAQEQEIRSALAKLQQEAAKQAQEAQQKGGEQHEPSEEPK